MMYIAPMIVFITGGLTGGLLLYAADCLIGRKERAKAPDCKDRILLTVNSDIFSSLKSSSTQTISMMLLNGAGWLFAVLLIGFDLPPKLGPK